MNSENVLLTPSQAPRIHIITPLDNKNSKNEKKKNPCKVFNSRIEEISTRTIQSSSQRDCIDWASAQACYERIPVDYIIIGIQKANWLSLLNSALSKPPDKVRISASQQSRMWGAVLIHTSMRDHYHCLSHQPRSIRVHLVQPFMESWTIFILTIFVFIFVFCLRHCSSPFVFMLFSPSTFNVSLLLSYTFCCVQWKEYPHAGYLLSSLSPWDKYAVTLRQRKPGKVAVAVIVHHFIEKHKPLLSILYCIIIIIIIILYQTRASSTRPIRSFWRFDRLDGYTILIENDR